MLIIRYTISMRVRQLKPPNDTSMTHTPRRVSIHTPFVATRRGAREGFPQARCLMSVMPVAISSGAPQEVPVLR